MLDIGLPADPKVPVAARAFAACLASAMEATLQEVPLYRSELPGSIRRWRGWLAGRGLGVVPIARPGGFNWPGYWIAVLGDTSMRGAEDRVVVLMFGSPSGVVLSPQDPGLLGRAAADLAVRDGYVLAGFDPASSAPTARPPLHGRVEAIAVADAATGPMRLVQRARAIAGRGLDGDRYAARAGTFTPRGGGAGYDLTLIQAEVLDDLALPGGADLGYAEARRNIVTRGIDLNALVGRRFRVGEAECLGQRLCEPCAHLERLTAPGVLRGLIHRGGLRADVVRDGRIGVAAAIETID